MKASDLSTRLLSFLCLKSHVRGRNDNDKKADVIFYSKIYLPDINILSFSPFLTPFNAALRLICLLQVPFLHACPFSQKDLCIFFLPFSLFFFDTPWGKVGLNIFFNVWFTWCVFNKSACQPYLHASLTVPFWRSSCTATRRLARFSQFRFNNHTSFFITLSSLTLRGTFFSSFHAESLLLPLLCKKKKKLLLSWNLQGAIYEFPKGRRELSTPVIPSSYLFKTLAMNYK